jgi:uridine kinase
MKLTELVETIINKEKKHPYVIAFEGMIGSGKSYEANLLKEQLCGKAQQISTDLFVRVPRSEWSKRLEAHDVDLHAWYDLQKIKQALESVKRKQSFIVSGLYNLSNGQFNDELHVDATDCDYLVLEGLLSCHEDLDEFVDLRVFLDVPKEIALERAHERDETVRHLDHDGWLQKKDIFYNHYLPYLESHKNRADIILTPD